MFRPAPNDPIDLGNYAYLFDQERNTAIKKLSREAAKFLMCVPIGIEGENANISIYFKFLNAQHQLACLDTLNQLTHCKVMRDFIISHNLADKAISEDEKKELNRYLDFINPKINASSHNSRKRKKSEQNKKVKKEQLDRTLCEPPAAVPSDFNDLLQSNDKMLLDNLRTEFSKNECPFLLPRKTGSVDTKYEYLEDQIKSIFQYYSNPLSPSFFKVKPDDIQGLMISSQQEDNEESFTLPSSHTV